MIAKIAVESATYAIDRPYSYNFDSEQNIQIGSRVLVPFGKGNKVVEGVVLALSEEDNYNKPLKSVIQNLDESPTIAIGSIKLALWMCSRYYCTFYSAIRTIIPSFMWYHYKTIWTLRNYNSESKVTKKEADILQLLQSGEKDSNYIKKVIKGNTDQSLNSLYNRDIISRNIIKYNNIKEKKYCYIQLCIPSEDVLLYIQKLRKNSNRVREFLKYLLENGTSSLQDIIYYSGVTKRNIDKLENEGIIKRIYREQGKEHIDLNTLYICDEQIILNDDQNSVFSSIYSDAVNSNSGVTLLHGITGSGKTKVYISLAKKLLLNGMSSIILVPEISLTPQMLKEFRHYLGNEVAILHSGLKDSERFDQWNKIKSGEAHVVLGTRSAIFAPAKNLSLIILDEEHETSYLSESSPCYHTIEIAKYRSKNEGAHVVLGSATPSIESMYYAKKGDYKLAVLTKRYNQKSLPKVIIADRKNDLRKGNLTSISTLLKDEISKVLNNHEQAILFLNRRGNSRKIICPDCGYVPECPNCSRFLTYHSANNRLMCHLCGYSEDMLIDCPQCHQSMIKMGIGTQKIEEDLSKLFPDISVLRMDADTVHNNYEEILSKFKNGQYDILIGTQMIAKGHDFPNVTLVGIIDADLSLYTDNYSSTERMFNLLTQVIGRAGRGTKDGIALIQTLTPENSIIQNASKQDYYSFYNHEITFREARHEPPFYDVVVITVSGIDERQVMIGCKVLSDAISKSANQNGIMIDIYGPAPLMTVRVNKLYRYKISIICKNTNILRRLVSNEMRDFSQSYNKLSISITTNFSE